MRVAIIGSSGSGKSMPAKRRGEALASPVIEPDAINWRAGWTDLNTHDPDEFVRRVEAAIAGDRWVSDGNYSRVLPAILKRATHLIWLDYSRPVVMSRVVRRSVSRAWPGREFWPGAGNRESWRRWLEKDHPIRWAWNTFAARRARYETLFADPRLAGLSLHRLRSPGEAAMLVSVLAVGEDVLRERPKL